MSLKEREMWQRAIEKWTRQADEAGVGTCCQIGYWRSSADAADEPELPFPTARDEWDGPCPKEDLLV